MLSSNLPQLKMSIVSKALMAFDKATSVVVLIVWGAALLFTVLAYSSVQRSMNAREELAAAEASTPLTPRINTQPLPEANVAQIGERLQRRYGSQIQITQNAGKLQISAKDASAFTTWLTAVTYLDVIRPDIAWKIEDLCVGSACPNNVMGVSLVAQTVSFDVPQPGAQ